MEYSGVQIKKTGQNNSSNVIALGHQELLNFRNDNALPVKAQKVKQDEVKIDMEDDVMARELEEDGEIMDDEVNQEIMKTYELQKKAKELFNKSKEKHISKSKVESNPECENNCSKTNSSNSGIPEDMLCIACYERRKEIMIVTCRHLVYCQPCETHYNSKNLLKKECPICRKEYKKTLPVLYT